MHFTSPQVPSHLLNENQSNTPCNVALFKASLAGSITGVETALKNGGEPNYFFRPEDQKASLHVACESGYYDIVKLLLANDAESNIISSTTQSYPLHYAAYNGNVAIIEVLIKHGADVNCQNAYGNTPLHIAVTEGNLAASNLLVDSKANLHITNKKGHNALHVYCYGEDRDRFPCSFILTLLKCGIDVNSRDARGMTPFLSACVSGRDDFLHMLIKNGANTNVKDNEGNNAMSVLTFYDHHTLAKNLSRDSVI